MLFLFYVIHCKLLFFFNQVFEEIGKLQNEKKETKSENLQLNQKLFCFQVKKKGSECIGVLFRIRTYLKKKLLENHIFQKVSFFQNMIYNFRTYALKNLIYKIFQNNINLKIKYFFSLFDRVSGSAKQIIRLRKNYKI